MPSTPKVAVRISAEDDFTASFLAFSKSLEGVRKQVTATQGAVAKANGGRGGSGSSSLLERINGQATKAQGQLRSAAGSVLGAVPGGSAVLGLGTVAGIGAAVTSFANFGVGLENTSKAAGMTVAGLNSVRGAARMTGLSAETADSAMVGLNGALHDAAFGRNADAANLFRRFGVDFGSMATGAKSVDSVLPKVADSLKQIYAVDPQAALRLGSTWGLSPDGVALLAKGSDELERLRQRAASLSPVTDASQASAKRYAESLGSIETAGTGLRNSLVTSLEPALTPLLNGMSGWIERNSKTEDGLKRIQLGAEAVAATALFRMLFGGAATSAAAKALLGLAATPMGAIVAGGLGAGAAAGAMNAPMVDDLGNVVGNWGGAEGERNAQAAADGRTPIPGWQPGGGNFFHRLLGGGGPTIPLKPGEQSANATAMRQVFKDAGLTPAYSASFIGNGIIESGLNPTADNGSHQGIFQWDDPRRKAVEDHFGKPVKSMTAAEQAQAAVWELDNTKRFAALGRRARSGTDLPSANEDVTSSFEVPANPGTPALAAEVAHRLRASQGALQAAEGASNSVPRSTPAMPAPSPADAAPSAVAITIHHRNVPADVRMEAEADGTGAAIKEIRTTHAMPNGRGY